MPQPSQLPMLHAGGFNWDEALVLVAAIIVVALLSWLTSWYGKRNE